MTPKKIYRGKWAGGLTTTTIALMLDCSQHIANKVLKNKETALERPITLVELGNLIYEYKRDKVSYSVDEFMQRWNIDVL